MTFWFQRPVTAGGSWQLAAGHYLARNMDMLWVHPRPDNEVNTWARQANAYPGLEYRIPLSVLGGSYPHHFEIITSPSGVTLDNASNNSGSGYVYDLVWNVPAEASGDYNFTVRVYDQEYNRGGNPSNYVDISWVVNVNTTVFIFVDATNGDDANTGEIGSPLQTVDGWFNSAYADAEYAGKIAVYRAGNYTVSKFESGADYVRLSTTNKPMVHIKYPGENAVFVCSGTGFLTTLTCSDLYIDLDITNTEAQSTNESAKGVWVTGTGARITLLSGLSEIGRGTGGTDNPAGYFFSSTVRQYITIRGSFSGSNSAPPFDIYGGKYVVVDDFVLSGTYTWGQLCFLKSDTQDATLRNITTGSTAFSCEYGVIELMGQEQSVRQENIEIQYCNIDGSGHANDRAIVTHWTGSLTSSPTRNIWIQRNTLRGVIAGLDSNQGVYVDNNIVVTNNGTPIFADGTYRDVIASGNATYGESAGVLNANGTLNNAHADYVANYGLKGWEIA